MTLVVSGVVVVGMVAVGEAVAYRWIGSRRGVSGEVVGMSLVGEAAVVLSTRVNRNDYDRVALSCPTSQLRMTHSELIAASRSSSCPKVVPGLSSRKEEKKVFWDTISTSKT
jgi:hypothetical protein